VDKKVTPQTTAIKQLAKKSGSSSQNSLIGSEPFPSFALPSRGAGWSEAMGRFFQFHFGESVASEFSAKFFAKGVDGQFSKCLDLPLSPQFEGAL